LGNGVLEDVEADTQSNTNKTNIN
jgi:serine/threonine-protein kinase SRPK3